MIKDHLADIDFRKKVVRQKDAIPQFKKWYDDLLKVERTEANWDLIQGQISMLSSVLWYLLPDKDYRKLTRLK